MPNERTTGVHEGEKPDPTSNCADEAIVGHCSVSSKRGVAEDGSELHNYIWACTSPGGSSEASQ